MSMFGDRSWKTAVTALLALPLSVCGGDKKAGTPTQPPITVPTTTPTTVAPTPDAPLSASCTRLSAGATKYTCSTAEPYFMDEVNEAIDTLRVEQPRIFNGDQVLDVGAYVVGLIRILDKKNLCADWDGEELGVARTNNLNDQYDVLTARGEVRRYFVGTCWPSTIPVRRRTAPPPPAGCALPPSVEVSCGDPASRFVEKVLAAITQVEKEKPELFDFADRSPQGWPRVKDMAAYQGAVIDVLTDQGFCGRLDGRGEEIELKRTNEFTEHFDINYQDKYVREGSGIYRGACYPAAF
jgi:hypothetical protein